MTCLLFLKWPDFLAHNNDIRNRKTDNRYGNQRDNIGTTIKTLWLSGKGPENLAMERFVKGPIDIIERMDFRMGSIIVAVASE